MRPSFALERLSVLDDGRVCYRLKRPWPRPGGITEIVLDPVDFLARLTALIPAPHVNMVRYHGVFAPASPLRGLVVPRQVVDCSHKRTAVVVATSTSTSTDALAKVDHGTEHDNRQNSAGARPAPASISPPCVASSPSDVMELRYLLGTMPSTEELLPIRARRLDWAALLARVWEIDVLECPRCAGPGLRQGRAGRMRVIAALSEPSLVAKVLSHIDLPTTLPQPAPARAPPSFEEDLGQGSFDLDAEIDQRAL